MKAIVQLRQKSNDQLQRRLIEIDISLRRVRGYLYGACKPPGEVTRGRGGENTMYAGNLRKEKARILTILNERKKRKEKALQLTRTERR